MNLQFIPNSILAGVRDNEPRAYSDLQSAIHSSDVNGIYVDMSQGSSYTEWLRKHRQEAYQKFQTWLDVENTWTSAEDLQEQVERWGLAQAGANFFAALASRFLQKAASEETSKQRELSCHGDRHRGGVTPPCSSRVFDPKGKFHFCNDCRCGARKIARLSEVGSAAENPIVSQKYIKFRAKVLRCPRKRKGFSNYEEPRRVQLPVLG